MRQFTSYLCSSKFITHDLIPVPYFSPVQRLEHEMDAILGAGYAPGASLQLGGGAAGPSASSAVDDVSANRIAAFQTAQEVDALLVQYSGALRELVERVNKEYSRQAEDPLEVIRSILDSQMAALAYVDREASALLVEARALDSQLALSGYGSNY